MARSVTLIYSIMIYLYLKTHNKTGLKYLGKTKNNPYTYRGSGKRWLSHLKVHGNDVTTEILRLCETNDEVREWGLKYSKQWNIVDDNSFANLTEERGDGGPTFRSTVINAAVSHKLVEHNKNLSKEYKTKRASNAAKSLWAKIAIDPSLKSRITLARKQQKNPMQGKKQKRACCVFCKKDLPVNQLKTHTCIK